ncbi:sulfite exporter TauE/SafE family protein [Candidatus Puniceispirillum sp.]|nr:sulfite exporter TauE/SafE family protein [Candidatus Puniceispirillum sp.]
MIIDHFLTADALFVLMAVFLGCFVKGALGFGLPLIATPIMMFVLPLPEIIAILVLPIAIANLYQIWLNRAHWRILQKFWSLIAASTLIMLLGAPIMVFLDGNFLGVLIGLMIFLHALLSGLPLSLVQAPSLTPRTMQKMIIPAGVVSGLLGSLTSMYSFPSLQLMLMMRVPKEDLNLLLGAFLSLGYIALWIGILKTGFPLGNNLTLSAFMMIPAVAGQQVGHIARRNISEAAFRHFVHFALACAGLMLMVKSSSELI